MRMDIERSGTLGPINVLARTTRAWGKPLFKSIWSASHAATSCCGRQPLRCFHAADALALLPMDSTALGLSLWRLPWYICRISFDAQMHPTLNSSPCSLRHDHGSGQIGFSAAVAHWVFAGACNGECCAFDCHVSLLYVVENLNRLDEAVQVLPLLRMASRASPPCHGLTLRPGAFVRDQYRVPLWRSQFMQGLSAAPFAFCRC